MKYLCATQVIQTLKVLLFLSCVKWFILSLVVLGPVLWSAGSIALWAVGACGSCGRLLRGAVAVT